MPASSDGQRLLSDLAAYMNLTIRIASILLVCLLGDVSTAHPGHDHVLTEEQALLRGKAIISSLVKNEEEINGATLDESWKQETNNATCKETPEYYLVAFDNREAGKTLYVLLTVAGKYLRANFSGQFADLTFSSYPVQSCS